jgi:hypothetical protein
LGEALARRSQICNPDWLRDIIEFIGYLESGARFLWNHQLASRAYPWLLIPVEWIDEYMYAQAVASVVQDSAPFAEFIASLIEEEDKYYNYE